MKRFNYYKLTGVLPAAVVFLMFMASQNTAAQPVSAPFSEDFNSGSLPAGWTNTSSSTSTNALWKFTGNPNGGASNANNGKTSGDYAWGDASFPEQPDVTLTTPLIDVTALNVPMLSFEWFSNNTTNPGDNTTLLVEVNNGSGWTNVGTFAGDDPNWVQEDIILAPYANDTIQVRFIHDQTTTTSSAFYNDMLLDDVSVDEAPTCFPVDSIQTVAKTSNSIDLDWVDFGPGQNWLIEYGPLGFALGTGDSTVAGTSPVTITGLNPGTMYEFYITTDCGGGDTSTITGPYLDTTNCVNTFAGNYTIDGSQPTGGTNYNTFNEIVSELMICGVTAPVTINVQPGTYNEQVKIGSIPGASATNDVKFIGAGASNSTLIFTQNVSEERYTLALEDASHITFDSMRIEADTNGSYGWGVQIMNNVNHFTLQNSEVIVDPSQTSSTRSAIVVSSNNSGFSSVSGTSDLTFDNNHISGGYYGIRVQGGNNDEVTNVTFTNNLIEEVYYYGNYFLYVDGLNYDQNTLDMTRNFGNSTVNSYGFYGSRVSDFVLSNNKFNNMGSYGFYLTNCFGTSANPSAVANNAIGGGFTSTSATTTAGIRVLNGSTEYVDFVHNSVNMDSGDGRAFSISSSNVSNLRLYNNNFVYTAGAAGMAYYVEDPANITESNNNNYYSNGNSFAYYGSGISDLAALQAVNIPTGNDTASVNLDPFYISGDSLVPQSAGLAGTGFTIPQVPIDINGATRGTPPDMGAYEFTPVFTEDLVLLSGEINGVCQLSNDSVYLTLVNTLGTTIDFSTNPIQADWNVSGPVNSTGSILINSGTLAVNDTLFLTDTGVDLSLEGTYTLTAFIDSTAMNQASRNDTLHTLTHDVVELLSVTPQIDTVTSPTALVELKAASPEFPTSEAFFTEICQFQTGTGSPTGGWPTYLGSDDYVEITSIPNADLTGFTYEQYSNTTNTITYTFPQGTVVGPNGTMILGTYYFGSETASPSDYYYVVDNPSSTSSSTSQGRLLRGPAGNIVDAVGYDGYDFTDFPAAAGVTSSDWSNPPSGGSSSSGIRLEGADDNTGNNWVLSSSSPQDPNTLNQNVTLPSPDPVAGFAWTLDTAFVDSFPEITVGPFTESGMYEYVAEMNTSCGFTVYDTSLIWVNLTNAQLVTSEDADCIGEASGFAAVQSTGGDAPYTYEWYYGNPPALLPVTAQSDNNLQAGDYLVIIKDANNWPDTVEFTLDEPDSLGLSLVDGGSVSCNGDTDGFLEVQGNGGTSPYSYFWSTGTPGNRLDNLGAGTYRVTVTDTNNCEYADTLEVSEPDELTIATDSTGDASCFGYADGFIAITAAGGTGTLSYDWNNNATDSSLTGIPAGNYEVTVVDANGCEEEDDFMIDEPAQLDTSLTNQHNSLLIANYDALIAEYAWWDCDAQELVAGETSREFEPADNGNYALVIQVNACRDTSDCLTLDRVSANDITNNASDWNIYPNPNNGLFSVRLTGNGESDTQIQIIDMQGKVISAKPLGRIDGEMVEEVNLNLSAGVYFVKIIQNDEVSVKRVVIQ